jgi:hypothetical protein
VNRIESVTADEGEAICPLRNEELAAVNGGALVPVGDGALIIVELVDPPSRWIRMMQPH